MKAREGIRAALLALDGIELLAKIAGLGAPVEAIHAALTTLRDAIDGKTSPQVALTHLETLHSDLAGTDGSIDAAIEKKTPPEGSSNR